MGLIFSCLTGDDLVTGRFLTLLFFFSIIFFGSSLLDGGFNTTIFAGFHGLMLFSVVTPLDELGWGIVVFVLSPSVMALEKKFLISRNFFFELSTPLHLVLLRLFVLRLIPLEYVGT